jgi:ABC-type uncharacterized transport system substrate-binding protein
MLSAVRSKKPHFDACFTGTRDAVSSFVAQHMKIRDIAKIGFIAAAANLGSINAVSAHPHVWVTMQTQVEFGPNEEVIGFKHKWTFDEYYTEFAVTGLDTNGDGIYQPEELKPLADTNVEALKEFGYFTFPMIGTTRLALKEPPPGYHLEYKDKLLTLYFTLPLEKPVPASKLKDFSFSVYDPGIYVDLSFSKKDPVTILSPKPTNCTPRVGDRPKGQEVTLGNSTAFAENIDPASNFGAQFAEKVTIECKP